MVIKCGGCLRKFNLDESLLRAGGSKVKCTKCGNIFRAFPPLPGSPKSLSGKKVKTRHSEPARRNPSPVDRIRQHTRIEISVPVSCIPEDLEGNPLNLYMGHVTEVSQTGVAVELFGDSISGLVSLSFVNHEDENVQIKGRVEHSVQTESGRLRVGVSLLGASRQVGRFVTNLVRAHYLTNKLEQD